MDSMGFRGHMVLLFEQVSDQEAEFWTTKRWTDHFLLNQHTVCCNNLVRLEISVFPMLMFNKINILTFRQMLCSIFNPSQKVTEKQQCPVSFISV